MANDDKHGSLRAKLSGLKLGSGSSGSITKMGSASERAHLVSEEKADTVGLERSWGPTQASSAFAQGSLPRSTSTASAYGAPPSLGVYVGPGSSVGGAGAGAGAGANIGAGAGAGGAGMGMGMGMMGNGDGVMRREAKAPNGLHRRASTGFMALSIPEPIPRPSFGKVDTYKKLEKLGEGTYASVYKGISAVNGKMVALKEIRLEAQEGAPCTAIREVSLLKGLKHANIVTLHDIIYNKSVLMLVFEYLEKDLKIYMDARGSFIDVINIRLFLFQLLRGLKYCHSRKVLHRDLKPQNLLINSIGELKLADFGLARAQSVPIRTYSHEVVTLWYRPPDVLLGSVDYTTSIDMWGVGCILYEMVSGRAIFPGADVEHQLRLIWHMLGTPTEERWPGVSQLPEYLPKSYPDLPRQDMAMYVPRLDRAGIDLLNRCLQYDPRQRISATDALEHRYFDSLGPEARALSAETSIFSLPHIVFRRDLRVRLNGTGTKKSGQRRSSVRF